MLNEIEKVSVKELMLDKNTISQFASIMGEEAAKKYIQSVLIEVANSNDLQECTPRSIMKAALDAASLELSCSRQLKQAWLVGFDVKVKARNIMRDGKPISIPEHWEKQAQFIPHYLGLRNLAMRTGRYRIINVSAVYKGQRVMENALTGLHSILEEGRKTLLEPDAYNPAYTDLIDVTDRRRKDLVRVGWIGYYEAYNREKKSVYWSIADIDDHARKHVKGYLDAQGNIKNPNWKDPEKRVVMEMKTVLRDLLSWTDKSGKDGANLAVAMQKDDADPEQQPEEEVITVESTTVTTPELSPTTSAEKPTDFISPLSKWAIDIAVAEWNCDEAQAKSSLGKFPASMTRGDFINQVTGVPA
jgi:recombination protein RecT